MGHHVVRVRVAALFVVGEHHVRPELADRADQRLGRLGHRYEREAALRQRGLGVALGQPGVNEPEKTLLHPEDLPGPRHLGPAHRGDVGLDLGPVHGRVQDVAALSAGQRADQDLSALADVARHGGRALAGLVVRVRVHGHQPELVGSAVQTFQR